MSQPIDLGHSTFQATGSPLELQFSAIANLSQFGSGAISSSTIKINHWKDLQSLWITEAPELELRIFVNADPAIDAIGPTFIANVEEELCNSKVWTDLGFEIILKSRRKFRESIASGSHCLAFGLCRRNTMPTSVNSKSIPPILRNPPEANIPSGIPTACLAVIDLHLKYAICDTVLQVDAQIVETLKQNTGNETERQQGYCSMHYTDLTGNNSVAEAFALSSIEDLLLLSDQPFDATEHINIDHREQTTQMMKGSERLPPQLLNLFEMGLRKLFLSGAAKNRSIKTVSKNELQSLFLLAPAIFNPEFHEAMKQRAASISTVSRSLISMLQNSNHSVIQNKLSAIRRDSTNPDRSLTSETLPAQTHAKPLIDNLKSTVESSLWIIAQHRLHKNKGPTNSAPFFALNHRPKQLPIQTDDDIILPDSSDRELDCDSNIFKPDSDTNLPLNLNYSTPFDEVLSDGSSILTFQDQFESTQTTELTQTTKTSSENFSQASECLPDICDDLEILLFDEILMDESLEGHELFEDMDLF